MRTTLQPLLLSALVLLAGIQTATGQTPTRKALIIGLDGVRPDALQAAATPNIDSLIANGAVSYSAQSEDITKSGICWSSGLTGTWRNKHGVTTNDFCNNNLAQYPGFYSYIKAACPGAYLASICYWESISNQILNAGDLLLGQLTDAQVTAQACNLLATGDPDCVYLHYNEIDLQGHVTGFDANDAMYKQEIQDNDADIGQILTTIQNRPNYAMEDWLIVVITDHGGIGTVHCGGSIDETTIFMIVSGPGADVGATISPPPMIVDLAPTVLTWLDFPINPAWGLDGQAVGLDLANVTSTFQCSGTGAFSSGPPPPASAVQVGSGCGCCGSWPVLSSTAPALACSYTISITNAPPMLNGILIASDVPPTSYPVGTSGCVAYIHVPEPWTWVTAPIGSDANGEWSLTLQNPSPAMMGLEVMVQAAFYPTNAPLGADVTNGLHLTFGI